MRSLVCFPHSGERVGEDAHPLGSGQGRSGGFDDLVAERRAAGGVERYEVLSGA